MRKNRPTYDQLAKRLAEVEPIIEALKRQEVDAVVGEEKIAFLLLRKVEEAWLESHGEFSAMFGLHGIGMIQADAPDFRFTRVNAKFCEITGYSIEELMSKTYMGLTHPQDHQNDLKEVAQVIRGKTDSWSIEKRCVRKDGSMIWVSVHGSALRDHSGRVVRIIAMIEDITFRKQAEQLQSDVQEQLRQQLQERTAAMLQTRQSLLNPVARRKLTDQVLLAIEEFIGNSMSPIADESKAGRSKPTPRKKASAKRTVKSTNKKVAPKRRPRL